MITVAFCNHKGGVGKTSSVLNIGAQLSKKHRVLLIDLDSQANLTHTLSHGKEHKETIYEALKGKIKEFPMFPIEEVSDRLSYVPSCLDLSGAELELSTQAGAQCILRELLENFEEEGKKWGGMYKYDYCLIDCPPSLSLLTVNALTVSDFVLIPTQAEAYAVHGLTKLIEVISLIKKRLNPKLQEPLFCITQYDKRKTLLKQVADSLRDRFGKRLLLPPIRNNIAIAEAQAQGKSIFSYDSASIGAEDYALLSEALSEILEHYKYT